MVEAPTGTKCSHCEQTRYGRCSYADCPWENDNSNEIVDRLERQIAELRAERVTLEERLATAYQAKYRCNEDANAERRINRQLSEALEKIEDVDFDGYSLSELHEYVTDIARAALSGSGAGATHRHKKRGSEYVLLGIGKMQAEYWREYDGTEEPYPSVDMREVAIYRSVDDGSLWARPREEFEDGRFEPLPAAPTGEAS